MPVQNWSRAASSLFPGLLLCAGVAATAVLLEPYVRRITPGTGLPAMVIALLIGMALNRAAQSARLQPGIVWCIKKLLRVAIALLGLRIAVGEILDLGLGSLSLVIVSMALTFVVAMALAKALGEQPGFGALAGAATAVCGASAALATTTVVPDYKNKAVDTAFTVVMANAVSTMVMLAYPPLGQWFGFTPQEMGLMLGATIHDVAQVVGAGYAVSDDVGNVAVVVKLFRVFLLLPIVVVIGWWFVQRSAESVAAKVPVPIFAIVFLGLILVNTVAASLSSVSPFYRPIKELVHGASSWGLLMAIAALGLNTSASAMLTVGWRPAVKFTGATVAILVAVSAGILLLR